MASNTANVYAAEPRSTGTCFVAPLATAAPTDARAPLNVAFVDLGYLGEDGIVETIDRSTDEKKAFGGDTIKVLQTDYSHEFTFTLSESTNADVLKAIYGAENVTITAANGAHGRQIKVNKTSRKLPHQAWVFDTTDSDNGSLLRQYIADGQITGTGDVNQVHTDTIEYEVTLKVFKTAGGPYVQMFSDDNVLANGS